MDDLYAVLGVERDADQAQIKAAYRRLAREYHPDRESGSVEHMVALNHAYAVLGHPERRRRYDLTQLAAPPPPADQVPWSEQDLDAHADDWRQMYAEERHLWEELLRAEPTSGPARASIEAALAEARQAQLALENALRARAGQPPLSAHAFDAQRAQEARQRAGPGATGCLLSLLGLALALAALRAAAVAAAAGRRR